MEKTPKLDRKELKQPDQFMKRGQAVFAFLLEKRKRFLPVLIGGAVLVGSVYAFDWWSQRKLEKGWVEYNRVNKLAGTERVDQLKVFQAGHAGDRPGYFAAVSVADYYYDEAKKEAVKKDGKPSEAATQAASWYGRALEFRGLLSGEKQLLYIDRGGAKEILGELDEANKDYQMAADFGGDPAGLARLSLGRIQEMKGDKAKAEEIYKKVSEDFVNTEYAKLAKSFLRRMSSPLWQETKS
jgi:hypothetical protein